MPVGREALHAMEGVRRDIRHDAERQPDDAEEGEMAEHDQRPRRAPGSAPKRARAPRRARRRGRATPSATASTSRPAIERHQHVGRGRQRRRARRSPATSQPLAAPVREGEAEDGAERLPRVPPSESSFMVFHRRAERAAGSSISFECCAGPEGAARELDGLGKRLAAPLGA